AGRTIAARCSGSAPGDAAYPLRGHVEQFPIHLVLPTAASRRHPERVIALLDEVQRGPRAESSRHRPDALALGEGIARALDEQQREGDAAQVLGPLAARLARRVQREAEEDD